MKWRNSLPAACIISAAAFLSSCSKDPLNHLSTAETQIYITDHDTTANFASYKTFSLPDSATVINNGAASKALTATDSAYLVAAAKYMQQAGYTRVANKQSADLAINVSRVYNTTGVLSLVDYFGYYGDYYDPYYWGYGGYGYYAPYAYGVYEITQGAISIDLLDLKNAAANKKINFLWTGIIRGEGIFDPATADGRVQALFAQSPYLKTN